MGAFIIIAARNLLQARRRTLLLAGALSSVSGFLVLLLSLSAGLTDTMIDSATLLVAGHVNVAGFYKAKPSDAYPMVTGTAKIREVLTEGVDGIEHILDRGRGWAKLVSETDTVQSGVAGIDLREEHALLERLALARESEYVEGGRDEVLGSIEGLQQANTIMIFANQAERLGVRVGDKITVATETINGKTNTIDVRVAAVARDLSFISSWSSFVPKQVVHDVYQLNDDTSGSIMVFLDDPRRTPDAAAEIREVLSAAGYRLMEPHAEPFWRKFGIVSGEDWVGQKLDVTTWEDEISYMRWVVVLLDTVSLSLVFILLIIIVVGIMNTMWIAVRERTQEIGTLRAIGMGRRKVLLMFLIEATMLGFAATTIGCLGGAGVALAIDAAQIAITNDAIRAVLMSNSLHLTVNSVQVLGPILAFTLVTIGAALWPALRASRLQPITAIHNVG